MRVQRWQQNEANAAENEALTCVRDANTSKVVVIACGVLLDLVVLQKAQELGFHICDPSGSRYRLEKVGTFLIEDIKSGDI